MQMPALASGMDTRDQPMLGGRRHYLPDLCDELQVRPRGRARAGGGCVPAPRRLRPVVLACLKRTKPACRLCCPWHDDALQPTMPSCQQNVAPLPRAELRFVVDAPSIYDREWWRRLLSSPGRTVAGPHACRRRNTRPLFPPGLPYLRLQRICGRPKAPLRLPRQLWRPLLQPPATALARGSRRASSPLRPDLRPRRPPLQLSHPPSYTTTRQCRHWRTRWRFGTSRTGRSRESAGGKQRAVRDAGPLHLLAGCWAHYSGC